MRILFLSLLLLVHGQPDCFKGEFWLDTECGEEECAHLNTWVGRKGAFSSTRKSAGAADFTGYGGRKRGGARVSK